MGHASRSTAISGVAREEARRRESLAPGTRLDRYELLHELAAGGMGTVWLARIEGKHGFETRVAIKTILMRFAHDRYIQDMFLNEARIAARIDHPNVVRILDLGEARSLVYLVMEWVDGAGLDQVRRRLRRGDEGSSFPLAHALRIVSDVASGLHAAHELRGENGEPLHVVHRDISPHNVLIAKSGVAKVIDFGVAKMRDHAAKATTLGTLKGKLRYMAPEQALGVEVDRRADVWALGAVLYELVCGRGVHEGMNDMAILARLTAHYELPPIPSTVPAALAEVLRRCLAQKPEDRFATALALRDAIDDVAMAEGARSRPEDLAAFVRVTLAGESNAATETAASDRSKVVAVSSLKTLPAAPDARRAAEARIPSPTESARFARARAARFALPIAAALLFVTVILARATSSHVPVAATRGESAVVEAPAAPPRIAEPIALPAPSAAPLVAIAIDAGAAAKPSSVKSAPVPAKRPAGARHTRSALEREARSSWQNPEEL